MDLPGLIEIEHSCPVKVASRIHSWRNIKDNPLLTHRI